MPERQMFGGIRRRIDMAIDALILRRGWRRAGEVPLDERHLRVRFGYDEEEDIKRVIDVVRLHTMTSFERLATLWQQVRYLDRFAIPGALVECGVWRGGSAGMMALAHLRHPSAPTREIHLFDSFQGLPEPRRDVDGEAAASYAHGAANGGLRPVDKCVGPLQDNSDLLERRIGYPRHLLHYHVGWFAETLPRDTPQLGKVALLRLDGDWYESTKICLEHLYPMVVRAGIVVIDDYGHWEGCRRAVDEFLATRSEPILLHHVDYTARCFVKPA